MSSDARMFFPRRPRQQQRAPCAGGNMNGNFGASMATAPFAAATQPSPHMGNGYILGGGPAPAGFNSCFANGGRMFHTGHGCPGWQRGGGATPQPAQNYQQLPQQPPPNVPHVPLVNGTHINMGVYSQQPPHQFYEYVPIQMNWVACEPAAAAAINPKGFIPPGPAQPHNGSYHANPQGFINGIKKLVNGFVNPNLNCDFYSDHNRHYNAKYRNNYVMDQRRAEQFASHPRPNANNYNNNCNARVKTVIVDLNSEGHHSSSPQASGKVTTTSAPAHNGHITGTDLSTSPVTATFEFTIFTNDDFPALPTVKKTVTPPPSMAAKVLSKVADKLPRARRKPRYAKSPSPARPQHEKPAQKSPVCAERTAAAARTTPETDITCEDFVVLPKPKINNNNNSHAINVPVRPMVDVSACTSKVATLPATPSDQCQSPVLMSPPQFLWQRSPRIRQISECSDDSFVICFSEDAQEGVLEVARDSDGDDDDSDLGSDSETETSSDDDEDYDETDHHYSHRGHGRCLADVGGQLDSGFDEKKDKKVRFNLTPKVHIMRTWNYAYRAARKGDWENFARDRDRFKKRINNVSLVLNPVLDKKHRETIYSARFQCDSKTDDNGAMDTTPPPVAASTTATLAEGAAVAAAQQ